MTLEELYADLQLKARCSIADVTPQWCAEAAACLAPYVEPCTARISTSRPKRAKR